MKRRFLDLAYLIAFLPFFVPYLFVLLVVRRRGLGPLGQRLGGVRVRERADDSSERVWVHAVSVGELQAAAPLVKALEESGRDVVVSTTTTSGLEIAVKRYGDDRAFLFPVDLSFACDRVLSRVRPDRVLLVELEIWPGFLAAAEAAEVPVDVVNGRVSERGFRRTNRVRGIYGRWLRRVRKFAVQTESYGERLQALGVPPERIVVTGNLKFERERATDEDRAGARADLAALLGVDLADPAPIVIAGSTHDADEAVLERVLARLRPHFPGLRLVCCPRHIERSDEVASRFASIGLTIGFHSDGPLPAGETRDVTIVDAVGELSRLYGGADVAYVGGGFDATEGHNLLEPVSAGTACVHGPRMKNFRHEVDAFTKPGFVFRVESADELEATLRQLLEFPEVRARVVEDARKELDRYRGSLARTLEALELTA